ncbi:MAG: class I tRNA ligase family protein [Bacteroidota bacterium]|nr:class I tRNA ligase family protein [Bacteroidota bacterium]
MEYKFTEIEQKWQAIWKERHTNRTENYIDKPTYYVLDMFPYPSGAGLHVGHPLGFIASDIVARYKRLAGFNVLHPMGFDSFGLPAEQYAIQTGQHPEKTTKENIARYIDQMNKIGFSFDWERKVCTSDPNYYKWTQWIFLQIFKSWYNNKTKKAEPIDLLISIFEKEGFSGNDERFSCADGEVQTFSAEQWKGFSEKEQSDVLMHFRLAYLDEAWVNWCPQLGTVLANDEVKDGVSERGGYPVERKRMPQWSMRITSYADRLLNDLDKLDWTESMKEAQRNWIGRSQGTSIKFGVLSFEFGVEVFTTRPDTIFGVTFVTLAPEHELVSQITTAEYKNAVDAYVTAAKSRSERERMADVKKITGQFTGAYVIHPFTNENIPVWIGDYVLAGYGTGAVMAVPAHDSRDYAFAKHFDLPIKQVVAPAGSSEVENKGAELQESYDAKEGKCINSDFLNGLDVKEAVKKAIEAIEKSGIGKGKVNYRLRDAAFGRQRYWGEPIPIYYKDGIPCAVDESDLPIVLPQVDKFLPTESGEPPLARAKNWVYAPHPRPLSSGEGSHGYGFDDSDSYEDNIVSEMLYPYQTSNKALWKKLKNLCRDNRKTPTEAENILWQELRNKKTGFKIRRQHAIDVFIADFICIGKKVVIEVDGEYHNDPEQIAYDEQRTFVLNELGFDVIRFFNSEVINNIAEVVARIKKYLDEKIVSVSAPPGQAEGGAETEALPLETTTMPGWAGSSWYFLRYMDPNNEKEFASKEAINYWKNVDLYLGGAEHATGHLLYVRFWTKFLFDMGHIPIDEPAQKLINQGMIQGVSMISKVVIINGNDDDTQEPYPNYLMLSPDDEMAKNSNVYEYHYPVEFVEFENGKYFITEKGVESTKKLYPAFIDFYLSGDKVEVTPIVEKMSKSKYNVVTPDLICDQYGADTLRLYEMFLGPLEQHKPWNTNGITGVFGFLKRFWRLFFDENGTIRVSNDAASEAELKVVHRTLKKIKDDIDRYSFNTCVSQFMICVNELMELKSYKREVLQPLVIALSPFAPHISEELWEVLGNKESVTKASFPTIDEKYLTDNSFAYPVQINGKVRFNFTASVQLTPAEVEKEILSSEEAIKWLEGKTPKKVIVVPKRIVNIVV